jgi:SAM-dependent methyltransferase
MIQGFADWLETPQGAYVRDWEQQKHDQIVADIFGFNAAQIGLPQLDYLRANRMPFRFRCDDAAGGGKVAVRATALHLPFAANSVDLVVLPHALEFEDNPHQVLREVERVLVPEGSVVVTGFNPFSLWGARRRLARRALPPPWRGNYISVPRLKDWFALLGFETRAGAFGCYAPPARQEKWLRRWQFMELAGDRWWSFAGGVYVMQAIKRVHGMRLITPVWGDRKARAQAMAAPLAQKKADGQ